jgi:hypothetical protein
MVCSPLILSLGGKGTKSNGTRNETSCQDLVEEAQTEKAHCQQEVGDAVRHEGSLLFVRQPPGAGLRSYYHYHHGDSSTLSQQQYDGRTLHFASAAT